MLNLQWLTVDNLKLQSEGQWTFVMEQHLALWQYTAATLGTVLTVMSAESA